MGPSVRFNKELWAKVKKVAEAGGYSSPEEFVVHIVEREIGKLDDGQTDEEILNRLKGLGYID